MTHTAVKERPIIFTGESVRAILDGRKTQTRRVITTQLPHGPFPCGWNGQGFAPASERGCSCQKMRPFYGHAGDRLWVREAWQTWGEMPLSEAEGPRDVRYAGDFDDFNYGVLSPWRSPIHMPRWASRLTLEITEVRVQRVQEISEEDASAEGSFLVRCACPVMQERPRTPMEALFRQTGCHVHGTEFRHLWDSVNARRGHSWASNPWVWCLTLRKLA